jgi:hypothetical protein
MGRGRFEGTHCETLAICRHLVHARAVFKEAIADKPTGRFMIRSRSRTRVVKRHPEGGGLGTDADQPWRRCRSSTELPAAAPVQFGPSRRNCPARP